MPVPLLAGFVAFATCVVWHVTALHNEIDAKDEQLLNRKRSRWIADKLGDYLLEAKGFFRHDGPMDRAIVDEWSGRVELMLSTTEELGRRYVAMFGNSTGIDYGPEPHAFNVYSGRRPLWYHAKTRITRLAEFVERWTDKAEGTR